MKKILLICLALLTPYIASAQVVATILEQEITPSVPDVDNDNRIYASFSYTIKVEGAAGHTLRVEVPLKDMYGKTVYFNIDNNEEAITDSRYEIESSTETIEGWAGAYHDAFWLKPGVHKLTGTIRIFDETAGKYITVKGAKPLSFSLTSTKKAPGIEITSCYIEGNQYYNNAKGMYVKYEFEANWMKGKEIKVDVSLYKANGSPLYQNNGKHDKLTWTTTSIYTFSTWSDRWAHFPYAGMNLPRGNTSCYAIIRFYDVKTGKLLKTSKKLEFDMTRS